MKKVIMLLTAALLAGTSTSMASSADATHATLKPLDWMKSADGLWMGKDNVWYKLDDKAQVWWSKDGKTWEMVKDGTWQDKDGRWLKIGNGKLWWSMDGKKWSEVPEWKWQGPDGTWYKFDKSWSLWVNKM